MASNSSTTPSFESRAELIPWDWYIKPNAPNPTCPSPSAILGTFAIVTASVSLLNLIFGNRLLVNKLTGGIFGKPAGSSWWFMFLVPLGTQLGANAFVAYMYTTTPGYAEGFSIVDMMLFYTIRPRMGWIVLIVTMSFGRRVEKGFQELPGQRREPTTSGSRMEEGMELISSHHQKEESERTMDEFNESRKVVDLPRRTVVLENGWYEASAKGAIIAEIFLLIIGSYYNGRTIHFATRHGYYLIGHLKGPHAHYARIMYVGALLSLVFLFTAITYLFAMLVTDDIIGGAGAVVVYIVGATTWLGSWLFWAGYVHLAGDLYCPPKLIESGAIWTAFSIIGTFFGGGF